VQRLTKPALFPRGTTQSRCPWTREGRALPRRSQAHSVPSACPSAQLLSASRGLTRCPRLARSSCLTRWIRRIKLVPKLTVRVRFPSPAPPAPCAKGLAIHTNWELSLLQGGAFRHQKSSLVPLPRAIPMRARLSANRCEWPDTLSCGLVRRGRHDRATAGRESNFKGAFKSAPASVRLEPSTAPRGEAPPSSSVSSPRACCTRATSARNASTALRYPAGQ
jgi:hypothetical protein